MSNLAWFGSLEPEVHVDFSGLTYPFTNCMSVSGERGEQLVLVNCLIEPDLGKNKNSESVLQQNTSLLIKLNIQSFMKSNLPDFS